MPCVHTSMHNFVLSERTAVVMLLDDVIQQHGFFDCKIQHLLRLATTRVSRGSNIDML